MSNSCDWAAVWGTSYSEKIFFKSNSSWENELIIAFLESKYNIGFNLCLNQSFHLQQYKVGEELFSMRCFVVSYSIKTLYIHSNIIQTTLNIIIYQKN